MQVGIDCLEGVADYLRTGIKTRESDIGFALIWKYMAISIKRAESGSP